MKHKEPILPVCEHEEHHHGAQEKSIKKIPKESVIYELTDFFKILGDSTRMHILLRWMERRFAFAIWQSFLE